MQSRDDIAADGTECSGAASPPTDVSEAPLGSPEIGAEAPASAALRKSAIAGSAWTLFAFGAGQAIRLGSNIVLAALLFEEAFALMAIVNAIIIGLAMFSDIGLGPSIVQNPRGDDQAFLDTAWTIQVVRGSVLALVAVILAWPLASFYAANDPLAWELRWLLPIVALGTLFEGFQSTKLKTAGRHIKLGRVTLLDLTCQLVSTTVMLGAAWKTRSVYALPLGSLAGMMLHATLSHWILPGNNNRLRWDPQIAREIVHFGRWVLASTIVTFFAMQLDKLLFGRLFPLSEVGVYAIAAGLAALTPTLMGRVQLSIAFPLYSRLLERKESLATIVRATKTPMLSIGGFLVALVIAGAETFFAAAYDARYAAAPKYVALLTCGAWFAVLEGVYGAALLASGKPAWVAASNLGKVLAFAALVVPASRWGGLLGAVFAVVASDVVKLAVALVGARTLDLKDRRPDVLFSVYVAVVGGAAMWIAPRAKSWLQLGSLPMLFVIAGAVTVAFAPLLARVARGALRGAR